jgi:hypothetical protein
MTVKILENNKISNFKSCCNSMNRNIDKTIKINRNKNGLNTAYIENSQNIILINNCPFCGSEITIL